MSPELPKEIWKDRVDNEIKCLESLQVIEPGSVVNEEESVNFIINIEALGFIMGNVEGKIDLTPKKHHRIALKINRSFPYPGGIDFLWNSDIFHPNIHPVDSNYFQEKGTGYICLNVLKKWSRLSDLETTAKALKMLVENPNPEDPLKYPICLEAAEFFKLNSMEGLREKFKIENAKSEEKTDDIIVIDD